MSFFVLLSTPFTPFISSIFCLVSKTNITKTFLVCIMFAIIMFAKLHIANPSYHRPLSSSRMVKYDNI
jgi:hypothetical protein